MPSQALSRREGGAAGQGHADACLDDLEDLSGHLA